MKILMLMALLVMIDFMTGYTRAYMKRELNSSVGLDGLIRKGMICFAMMGFIVFDYIASFNLISMLPEAVREWLQSSDVIQMGLSDIMGIGIILQEMTSILENLHQLGLPLPRFVTYRIQRIKESYLNEE
ncbi:MAG: phage holin family protein [Turicibacter sp.]